MDGERLKQVEEIYHAALEVLPAGREAFFKVRCGEDIDLRREVESLLSFEDTFDGLIDTPPESLAAEIFFEREEQTNLTGKKISHYKIKKLLGKGGMGEVYLADDVNLNRQVALKFLPAELVGNIDRLKRFEQEAQSASALNHPNILTIHEFGTENDSRFIVMEFVKGITLSEKMAGGRLTASETLEVAVQVASALSEAHEAGIIHRDIKPDNIMMRCDRLVKVLDFGLAKLIEQRGNIHTTDPEAKTRARVKTNPGAVMGTVDYMSPEQARGKKTDARTDVFSLGVVLYEMITGQKPFTGETVNHTIVNILEKEPPPISAQVADCPAELERIIQKTLAKNADERYRAAKDLLTNLKKLQKRLDFEAEFGRSSQPAEATEAKTQILEAGFDGEPALIPPNNLSKEFPSIIGRQAETAEIMDLLRQPDTRLLTVTGVGGTGKTTLAQAVVRASLDEFTDGVYYVALAPIDNYELVAPIIAQTLGVREEGGKSLIECLRDYLRERKMLIVLDNFEQIAKAAPVLGELLADSPNLKILVTSRVRLNLKLEREFTLQPLEVPTDKRLTASEFGEYPAVELFVKRAKAAKFDFALTEENAAIVAEICRHLDGLPLAIELAAARVKLFAPQAIFKRLENSLNLLTGGAKDLPERQQTMRGAIRWSYDLLDADEKKLLNRLSVFRGGLTLEGAEAIGNAEADLSVDLLDAVSSLVDKSLLSQREQKDGEPRFRMLKVVREFAFEKLAENGEAEEIMRRHADFYNALSKNAEAEIYGAKSGQWCEKLEQEHDNIRHALRWTLDNKPKIALQIALSNYLFWLRQGYLAEGCGWMTEALEKGGDDADPKLRVNVYRKAADLFQRRGDSESADSFGEEALRLSRRLGDKQIISYSLGGLAAIKNARGDFKQARRFAEEGLAIAIEINDQIHIGIILNSLGEIARGEEDYRAARKYYEDALEISRQESPVNSHYYMGNLACITYLLGDYRAASSYALEVLKLHEEFGDKVIIAQSTGVLAAVALKEGKLKKAARLAGAEAAVHETIGNKPGKVNQDFIDIYIKEIRAAIGDEAFDAAFSQGRALSLKEAVALARENESELKSAMAAHITDEARSGAISFQPAARSTGQSHVSTGAAHGVSSAEYVVGEVKKHRFGFALAVATILLAALVAVGYFAYFRPQPINSIAVLPFVYVGDTGGDGEFLSDGLSENLINTLSRLPQLKVIARSSSFKFRGENIDVQDAAKKLGVAAILTGRVVRRGDDLQISVELINTADNTRIWGDIYNRKVSGALILPEEIAQAVSEKLQLKMSDAQERQIAKRVTNNPQAYQLHLNGVFFRRKNGAENIRKAIEYQNQAIALDTNFALAYVELSINYANLTEIGALSPQEGLPRTRAAAEKAMALDETLAEAHYNIGRIKNYGFDWAGAEQAFRRAIELNPNLAAAHTIYAEYLSQLGRFDEALREIKLAQELDPLRVGLIGNEGNILYYARRYDEAIEKMQNGLKPEPENAPARVFLGQAYTAAGQYENAIRELQTANESDKETTRALIQLGRAYALSGKRDEAAAILNEIKKTKKYVSPAALAAFYAALGDKEAAFKSLEQARAERDLQLQFLKVEPSYDSLRDDPRFKEMMKRLNLPE